MGNYNMEIETTLWMIKEDLIPRRRGTILKHPNRPVTGNLKHNATKIEYPEQNMSRVFIDDNIAPYVPYTNEPWVSPKWKGAKNPNEGWFHDFTYEYARMLAQLIGGELRVIEDNEE